MDIALCYEKLVPARGGAERYIASLAHYLVADGHSVHVYASQWDVGALPPGIRYHRLPMARGPRFLRPWRFAKSCARALRLGEHDLTVGFNKTWGQDVLYPQGGLHAASAAHNLLKYRSTSRRRIAGLIRAVDPAHRSYCLLERRQYLGRKRPLIIANSNMVRRHFHEYYGVPASDVRVVRVAFDPQRFLDSDRPHRRYDARQHWGIGPEEPVGVFIAMNYELKGLVPLLHALRHLPADRPFRLLVAGNRHTERFARLANRLGVGARVVFAGFCPDMRDCYFAADFLVHPTFYDPCSLVVLEAMACGLPVITSRNNGASELFQAPHEGLIIDDPHDHKHLAWCLAQFLDPSRRVACAQAVRRRAGVWTFAKHYRELMNAFREAVARRRAA